MLIEIFVAPEGCSSCGRAGRLVRQVADDYAGVEVREVHITEAVERIVNYGIFTTPFVVIDGSVEFIGVPHEPELRQHLEAAFKRGQKGNERPPA
jgi:glutaredoxin